MTNGLRLEKIIGFNSTDNACVDANPTSDDIAYAAGIFTLEFLLFTQHMCRLCCGCLQS